MYENSCWYPEWLTMQTGLWGLNWALVIGLIVEAIWSESVVGYRADHGCYLVRSGCRLSGWSWRLTGLNRMSLIGLIVVTIWSESGVGYRADRAGYLVSRARIWTSKLFRRCVCRKLNTTLQYYILHNTTRVLNQTWHWEHYKCVLSRLGTEITAKSVLTRLGTENTTGVF